MSPMHSSERFLFCFVLTIAHIVIILLYLFLTHYMYLLPFSLSSPISHQGKHGRLDSTKRDGCDDCEIGTASNEVSLATPCPTCPTGFAAPEGEGNTACSACLAGKFQEKNSDDEMICTNCKAGRFTNSSNALKCLACDPGEYQYATGKTACLPCIPVRDFLFFLIKQSQDRDY